MVLLWKRPQAFSTDCLQTCLVSKDLNHQIRRSQLLFRSGFFWPSAFCPTWILEEFWWFLFWRRISNWPRKSLNSSRKSSWPHLMMIKIVNLNIAALWLKVFYLYRIFLHFAASDFLKAILKPSSWGWVNECNFFLKNGNQNFFL